jgi:methyl-accepting chemotaxis protein
MYQASLNNEFERVSLEDGKFRLVENFEIEVKNSKIIKVQQIFVDSKLEDGTQIRVEGDSLVEGAKVVVITEEGEMPAPDGVHTLEDGTKVETKEGVISMIEEKVEAGYKDKMEEEKPMVESKDPIQEIVSLLKDMMEKVSQKMKEMEEKVEEVKADFSKFKSEPASKKIANGKTDYNKSTNNNDDALQSKLDMIAALRKNNK